MKDRLVLLFVFALLAGLIMPIRAASAEETALSRSAETRAEAVARWRAEPYRIEPPDVLSLELKWENFQGTMKQVPLRAETLHLKTKLLVEPDGHVNLDGFGQVQVAGKTVEEAKATLAEKFGKEHGKPLIALDVVQTNSKVVYLIVRQASGDFVERIPHHGQLTVLDALADEDLNHEDTLYIAPTERPEDPLKIDVEMLLSKNNDTANHHLLPGDRVFLIRQGSEPSPRVSTGSKSVPPPTRVREFNPYEKTE